MIITTEIVVIKIEPCGCDAEGSLLVRMPPVGRELWAYYQGSDRQFAELLPVGAHANVLMYLVYGTLASSSRQVRNVSQAGKAHSYFVSGVYRGQFNLGDLILHHIESEFPVLVDPESVSNQELRDGDWVETQGAFFVDYLAEFNIVST